MKLMKQINDLIDHFKKLFSKEGKIDEIKSDRETIPNQQREKSGNMNVSITEKEVEQNSGKLKFDPLTNKMLKCTNSQGIKMLKMLFNKILKSRTFPTSWNYGLIK